MATSDAFIGGGALLATDIKLSGQNYQDWEFSARMLLRSIGLASHLTDDPPGAADAAKTKVWSTADDRVMGIIFMSVDVSIRMSFRAHTSAKEMWDYLKERYTQGSGALRFSLLQSLSSLQQQEETVQEFYTMFTRLTGQLEAQIPKAASGCVQCKAKEKHEQEDMVYQFVMRLRPDFESIRGQLLGRSTRPSMAEALSSLISEETRINSLKHTSTTAVISHNVLAAPQRHGAPRSGVPKINFNTRDVTCSHCKKVGHSSVDCFQLHPEKLVDYRARRAASFRPRVAGCTDTAAGSSNTSAYGAAAASSAPQSSFVAGPSYQSSDWSWPSP